MGNLWSYHQSWSPVAVHMPAQRENIAKLSSNNFDGHCSSGFLRSDSDVQFFSVGLQESGHKLQFSVSDKLKISYYIYVRGPIHPQKEKRMLHTQRLQSKWKQQTNRRQFGWEAEMAVKWNWTPHNSEKESLSWTVLYYVATGSELS